MWKGGKGSTTNDTTQDFFKVCLRTIRIYKNELEVVWVTKVKEIIKKYTRSNVESKETFKGGRETVTNFQTIHDQDNPKKCQPVIDPKTNYTSHKGFPPHFTSQYILILYVSNKRHREKKGKRR